MPNVLADRHHAGLYHFLQRLGARLGWDLYTPVGYDWWEQGYWRFGEGYGDRRLADQYLSTADASWSHWKEDEDGIWVTADHEYPDWLIQGIELDAARASEWDYVIATVQDNQQGFKRFATEVGAKYVYQVGNTGQQVDWSLDPLAIVTSEVPIDGRGVRCLQEMHPAYGWTGLPANPLVVRSFVNAASALPCWPTTMALWQETGDLFTWELYGSSLPLGSISPTTRIAALMADSGWAHHDKTHGDGFGHVLWGWAAVGRPLIGHASHYKGKLGEVLWRDLITCIDLDKHSVTEAAQLMRDISDDPLNAHAAMCHAMRETFDAYYDPEKDAANIARLLGVWK